MLNLASIVSDRAGQPISRLVTRPGSRCPRTSSEADRVGKVGEADSGSLGDMPLAAAMRNGQSSSRLPARQRGPRDCIGRRVAGRGWSPGAHAGGVQALGPRADGPGARAVADPTTSPPMPTAESLTGDAQASSRWSGSPVRRLGRVVWRTAAQVLSARSACGSTPVISASGAAHMRVGHCVPIVPCSLFSTCRRRRSTRTFRTPRAPPGGHRRGSAWACASPSKL